MTHWQQTISGINNAQNGDRLETCRLGLFVRLLFNEAGLRHTKRSLFYSLARPDGRDWWWAAQERLRLAFTATVNHWTGGTGWPVRYCRMSDRPSLCFRRSGCSEDLELAWFIGSALSMCGCLREIITGTNNRRKGFANCSACIIQPTRYERSCPMSKLSLYFALFRYRRQQFTAFFSYFVYM